MCAGTRVQAFKRAVGRSYRVIDRLDVVPALPPFQGYVQLEFPLWIQVCPGKGPAVLDQHPFSGPS
jgi:hypothetical protein